MIIKNTQFAKKVIKRVPGWSSFNDMGKYISLMSIFYIVKGRFLNFFESFEELFLSKITHIICLFKYY